MTTNAPFNRSRRDALRLLGLAPLVLAACGSGGESTSAPSIAEATARTTDGLAYDVAAIEGEAMLWFWAPW